MIIHRALVCLQVQAGIASFLSLSYIAPVTASVIADTGATCRLDAPDDIYAGTSKICGLRL